MSRVGVLHCYDCGADVPVGAEVDAHNYGRLLMQASVRCIDCERKAGEELDRLRERVKVLEQMVCPPYRLTERGKQAAAEAATKGGE